MKSCSHSSVLELSLHIALLVLAQSGFQRVEAIVFPIVSHCLHPLWYRKSYCMEYGMKLHGLKCKIIYSTTIQKSYILCFE